MPQNYRFSYTFIYYIRENYYNLWQNAKLICKIMQKSGNAMGNYEELFIFVGKLKYIFHND
jgi:hypothetical protein